MKKRRLMGIIIAFAMVCILLVGCVPPTTPDNPIGGGGNDNVKEVRTVDFYAINDFHGAVDNMSTVAGYLTEQKHKNANSIVISSGDMFQGSMESNSNYGKLLSQCMDDVGFDAFTYGNHEFDWGLTKLQELAQSSRTPFLGANIYHWDANTRQFGTFADELAREYVVKTLPNGLKIGIIGVIGQRQITSISANLVQTIGFKDVADVIPSLAHKLRNDLDCDVVVVSAHTGQETFLENEYFDVTEYADAVFCAHTHQKEISQKNGVPFIQGGSYGRNVSHVVLSVGIDGKVTAKKSENIAYQYSWPNKVSVQTLIDNSNEKIQSEANEVLANFDNELNAYLGVPRLVCHAIANFVTNNYAQYDVALAMVNQGRSGIGYGELTYSELYQSIPFDNTVYIANVSGADIYKEASYSGNEIWRINGQAIEDSDTKFYKIAVIDYLLFHQNANRNYDYFPSAFSANNTFTPVPLENSNYDIYNYRFITKDFLMENTEINSSYYNYDNDFTNKQNLSNEVASAFSLAIDDAFGVDFEGNAMSFTQYMLPISSIETLAQRRL